MKSALFFCLMSISCLSFASGEVNQGETFTLIERANAVVYANGTSYDPWRGEAQQYLFKTAISVCRQQNLATSVVEDIAWRDESYLNFEGLWFAKFECINKNGAAEHFYLEEMRTNPYNLRVSALLKCMNEYNGFAVYQNSDYRSFRRDVVDPYSGHMDNHPFGAASYVCIISR